MFKFKFIFGDFFQQYVVKLTCDAMFHVYRDY